MAIVKDVCEVLHRIRCKLYPNHLPGSGGAYIARANNEASLSIEQVCAALKNRGGFSGNYDILVEYVRRFFNEAAYQLCDGYSINTGYFTVSPRVGGTFDSANEVYDSKKNPLSFHFRPNAPLRVLAEHVSVEIEGLADISGYIDKFRDMETDTVNSVFVQGGHFCVSGRKIKLAGDDPNVGIFFVPVDNPEKAIKVTRIAENTPRRIIGIAPVTEYRYNRIEIRTQYTGASNTPLKVPRVITGGFTIETLA